MVMTRDPVQKSQFHISGMDCPSEEQLIRSALGSVEGIERIDFDIPQRTLTLWHREAAGQALLCLEMLDLGTKLVLTKEVPESEAAEGEEQDQTNVLRLLLAINASLFAIELVAGWLAESTGLISDSLDMLADAIVYGIALWSVTRAKSSQRLAARVSGYVQLLLAFGVLAEVARRALLGSQPEAPLIMGTATLALLANLVCVMALARHRKAGVHMRASWIFTTNDVLANLGVILAGALVYWTSSSVPDLVAGACIAAIVMRGAFRILRLSRPMQIAEP